MNTKKYIYITKRLIFIVPLTLAISVVVFLLLNLVLIAQNFAPVGAVWHYTQAHSFSPNKSFFKIKIQTNVNDISSPERSVLYLIFYL